MLLMLAGSGAVAADSGDRAAGLDAAPAHIRAYPQQAERAEALQRCLAFANVPGKRWPEPA